MSRITSKLQVTLPKALADRYRIRPGDEIEWQAAGDTIRILPAGPPRGTQSTEARLVQFDQATERQRRRQANIRAKRSATRGWTREELHRRGRAD